MKLRNNLVALLLVVCSSYSYSDIVTGITTNAASGGLTWSMADVLPKEAGLTVNTVIYRYTAIKQIQDEMYVNIQNKDALSDGYVFRQTDNWSSLPGNTITKVVPVNNIPIQRWGDGEINVQGTGRVANANVAYGYKYDTCFNPMSDPSCPGYNDAMYDWLLKNGLLNNKTEVVDPLADKNVKESIDRKAVIKEEEKEDKDKKDKDKEKEDKRKQIGLAAAANTVATALEITQSNAIAAMNNVPQFNTYYNTSMKGGSYADVLAYKPTTIPENKRGLRVGLAQQILHDKMVDSQYKH